MSAEVSRLPSQPVVDPEAKSHPARVEISAALTVARGRAHEFFGSLPS